MHHRHGAGVQERGDEIAIRRSVDAWSRIANVEFQIVSSDKLSASAAGVAGDGVSLVTIAATPENVLLFSKDPENAAATTRIFYNRRGSITEADIVLNPYQQFSTDGTIGTFDLESTLTHEIGHLLGLNHSSVLGSTMHANNARNGVFGLQSFGARTLSAADIATVRSIYGMRDADEDCCGSVEGKVALGNRPSRNLEVWIEDLSGRVHGSVRLSGSEDFRFDGLGNGKYRVLAQELGRLRMSYPVQELGVATVAASETVVVNGKPSPLAREFEVTYMGFNGKLSEMAVPLSAGRIHTVYLGGRNLDPRRISVSFNSPYLSLVPGTMRSLDYGPDISVISFDVRVGPRAARGEYSVYVDSERGDRRAIVGGLTVDSFSNPWTLAAAGDD